MQTNISKSSSREEKMHELFEEFQMLRKRIILPRVAREGEGITPSQLRALFLIQAEKNCTIKEIATTLKITSSAATQLVDGLVLAGYAERKENPEDRRMALLNLTQKAKKQHEKIKKMVFKQLLEVFGELTDEEMTQYMYLTHKISTTANIT